jgi:hypothetical protein
LVILHIKRVPNSISCVLFFPLLHTTCLFTICIMYDREVGCFRLQVI